MSLILAQGSSKPTYPYDHFYGIEITNWAQNTSSALNPINADLMDESKGARPIWTRIRSFVEKPDGTVKYYLDKLDSRYKEGGSALADLTGRDGNVMVEIPEYYMKQEWVDGAYRRLYSEYPLPGFFRVPRRVIAKFMNTLYTGANDGALVQNGLVSNCLLKWEAGSGYGTVTNGSLSPVLRKAATVESGVGLLDFGSNEDLAKLCRGGSSSSSANDEAYNSMLGMCRTYLSRTNYRSYCANVNSAAMTNGYDITTENMLHIGTFHIYNELAWLARIKTLNYDIQNTTAVPEFGGSAAKIDWTTWGNLGYNPFIPNGITAPLGDRIGYVKFKYRTGSDETSFKECYAETVFGVELPLGFIWHITDDLLIYNDATNSESRAYYCADPSKFATPADSSPESWAAEHGYEYIANIPFGNSNGSYVARESFAENGLSLPRDLGSGQVKDYNYSSGAAGWFGSLFGGVAHLGAAAGFGYLHAADRAANAYATVGARSCRN